MVSPESEEDHQHGSQYKTVHAESSGWFEDDTILKLIDFLSTPKPPSHFDQFVFERGGGQIMDLWQNFVGTVSLIQFHQNMGRV